jgi:hypothetical protein
MHAPHSAHPSPTKALLSCILMTSIGQALTHFPHPVHFAELIFAAIANILSLSIKNCVYC